MKRYQGGGFTNETEVPKNNKGPICMEPKLYNVYVVKLKINEQEIYMIDRLEQQFHLKKQ